ncbi:hypothetical protein CJJ23_03725 [Mycoplasmopsis agassizii]|uniref:Smf/DprA SLOG domain-containing protein n=1 Tax=Mycoplasmopsis agassizii TaxID=33922 RepID=A0A269TI60_9BACT|nr:DNA-processing protein DprA [Mycoplasmopsis agassizii]PAK21081.1 hypothetical protein CJJ23_03725 [Mycoplasmopsis agassizii]
MKDIIVYFWIKNKGDFTLAYNDINKRNAIDYGVYLFYLNKMKELDIKFITILDDEYPKELLNSNKPPLVIFYKGNYELLHSANKHTLNGDIEDAEAVHLMNDFFENHPKITLVTSNFPGFESQIINKAREQNIGIIHVLANGLESPYLGNNQINFDKELLLTKYPWYVHVKHSRFYERNEMIAHFSKQLSLLKLKPSSKILNQLHYFLELGKEIFVFETKDKNAANQGLLDEGASNLTNTFKYN